jgi:hypothetical protein
MRWQHTLLLGAIGACVATVEPGFGGSVNAGVQQGVLVVEDVNADEHPVCYVDSGHIPYSQGQEKQRQRDPRAAIAAYQAVIEKHRDEIEFSAPALVNLVACFQWLKGDTAAEKQYALLSSQYLSKPPPLDGASALDLEQAKDDILWKAWSDPVAGETTDICHTQHVAAGRVIMMLRDISKRKTSEDTCTLEPSLLVSEDSTQRHLEDAEIVDLSLIDPVGREYTMKRPDADLGGLALSFRMKMDPKVENVPRTLLHGITIRGRVKLAKARTFKTAELRLTLGATAMFGTRRYTVKAVSTDQVTRIVHVVYATTDSSPDSQDGDAAVTSMNDYFDPVRPVLCTEAGYRINPESFSFGPNDTRSADYSYPPNDKPVCLRFRMTTEVATREFPFEFKNVEVP